MKTTATILAAVCFFALLAAIPAAAQEIAITIDDAPRSDGQLMTGERRTRTLITSLKNAGVDDVLIFVTTSHINDQWDKLRLRRYTDAGFHLANHSHTHLSADRVDVDTYLKDFDIADGILRTYDNFLPLYRYTFLHEGNTADKRDRIRDHLQTRGYRNGYVTVDNYEWYMDALLQRALKEGRTVDYDKLRDVYVEVMWGAIRFYDNIARESIGRSPRHVLLVHENDITALFIGDLVRYLRSKGWKIISPRHAYDDPIASDVPDVLFNNQGRVAAIARARGWEKRSLIHEAEDEAYLENLFNDRRIFE
jgi:peptidoglycan/xylan/chitin deacetylase (PgdA/CDA1 family)